MTQTPESTPSPTGPGEAAPRLTVHGLDVILPDGHRLLEDLSLEVAAGEVVVVLGGSGSGKSTFSRVLFERQTLERQGFEIIADTLDMREGELGLVPQRGALFDHLDVRGNLDLALRYAEPAADDTDGDRGAARRRRREEPARWLERVGLAPELADPGIPVSSLSGGQAQRVAVARALAGRRKLLFLDEPSVGLDPYRVRVLARLIREQVETLGIAAIVVTHDVALAAGVADRLYFLDPASRRFDQLFADDWPGPIESPDIPAEERGRWLIELENALVERIENAAPGRKGSRRSRTRARHAGLGSLATTLVAPFATAAVSLRHLPGHALTRPGDFLAVGRRVAVQTLLRPLPFYAIVSLLIGYTVLLVISKVGGAGVRPDALIRQIGGSYVVALAPPLSAILFVSASGSATNAWLGSMGLTRQTLAMDALGVNSRAYLWSPAWLVLGIAYLGTASLFATGMIAGGMVVCSQYGLANAWELLTGDILDPRPERMASAVRAGFLIWVYAWGIASDVIAKGGGEKNEADAVTRGMTASVVSCTLWVVAWELASVLVVFEP